MLVGILNVFLNYTINKSILWVQSFMMVVYNFFYNLIISSLCFIIICETSSAKLHRKTIAILTVINIFINIVCAVSILYAINSDQSNMWGKLTFVFLSAAVSCVIWCFLCLLKLKKRTFKELNLMFQRQVPKKVFKNYMFENEVHNEKNV